VSKELETQPIDVYEKEGYWSHGGQQIAKVVIVLNPIQHRDSHVR